MDHYKHFVLVNGERVYFGFDGRRLSLFGGSLEIRFPRVITLEEAKEDVEKNYNKYREEDLMATYEAFGFYD